MRMSLWSAMLGLAIGAWGCGEECTRLDGSQCTLISCAFETIRCERYPAPNDAIKVSYLVNLDEGREYTAVLVVDIEGIDPIAGWSFDGDEFHNRVNFYRLGQGAWPPIDTGKCQFSQGGAVGSDLEGKCSFRFDNGYNATAGFCCTLTEPDLSPP
jgi:hypothetical protein